MLGIILNITIYFILSFYYLLFPYDWQKFDKNVPAKCKDKHNNVDFTNKLLLRFVIHNKYNLDSTWLRWKDIYCGIIWNV